MLRLLPGTLSILLTFALLAATFTGIGLLLRRAFGVLELELDDCFASFWVGFGAVLLFLLLWNFVFPVGAGALVLVLATGLAGLHANRRRLADAARAWTPQAPGIAALVLAWLWVANLSLGELVNWDSALYHYQAVKWAHEYPVVPGLANLFGPLGFNNASLLYDAMLETGPFSGRAWHIANGLLMVVLLTQCLVGGMRFLEERRSAERARHIFAFLLMAAITSQVVGEHLSSFVTDLPRAALRLALTALWYRALVSERRLPVQEAWDLVCIVVMSAALVSIKLNSAVFALITVITAAVIWLRRLRPEPVIRRRTAVWCTAAGIAFGAAWTGRGVVLSGYPLFPSHVLPAPVEWRVPAEHAQAEYDYVIHSSHGTANNLDVVSGRVPGLGGWLPGWLRRQLDAPYYQPIPLLLALVMLPGLIRALRRAGPEQRRRARWAWLMLVPTLASMAAWFALAPEPRYAAGLFWSLAALVAGQTVLLSDADAEPRRRRLAFSAALLLGVSPIIVSPLLLWSRSPEGSPLAAVIRANLRIPATGAWFQPAIKTPILMPYRTRSGLILNIPKQLCWDGALPCTPNPAPNLRLRVPGRIDKGFAVDGRWQMLYWPQKWRPDFLPAWRASPNGRRFQGSE